jgi:hypothetical protein
MNSNREFKSKWLQLCAFLHATRSLRYLRTELGSEGLAYFVFSDPYDDAPNLEFKFSQGATVSAITLFGSLTFLRRALKTAQNTLGESHHVSSQSHR